MAKPSEDVLRLLSLHSPRGAIERANVKGARIKFYSINGKFLSGEIIVALCRKPLDKIIEDAKKWCEAQFKIGAPTYFEVVGK